MTLLPIITLLGLMGLSLTGLPQSFAQIEQKFDLENTASNVSLPEDNDKLNSKTPSLDLDITTNISKILKPSPDIINPANNQDSPSTGYEISKQLLITMQQQKIHVQLLWIMKPN